MKIISVFLMGLIYVNNAYAITIGNSSVDLAANIKLDSVYSSTSNLVDVGNLFLLGSGISLDNNSESAFRMSARQTKFSIHTVTPYNDKKIDTHFAFDFYGSNGNEVITNSHNPRLLIAWLNYGGFGFGQNWSNFVILPSVPKQNNFGTVIGGVSPVRQAQLRYNYNNWSLSIENPETTENKGFNSTKKDSIPDVFIRKNIKTDNLNVSAVLGYRNLIAKNGESKDGLLASIGGVIHPNNSDKIKASIAFGALGRYTSTGLYPDLVVNDTNVVLLDTLALNLGFEKQWTDKLSSSIQFGYSKVNNDRYLSELMNKSGKSIMFSSFYRLDPEILVGFDVGKHERYTKSGKSGKLDRLQISISRKF